jgi:hypothetical protein
MSQAEPLKATFSRDEIEKRINETLEREGEINREFTEIKPSINDLIYDELRNIHGLLQERLGQDGVLDSIDERMCETNDLLWQLVEKENNPTRKEERGLITQEDIDNYMNSVKDYYVFDDKGNCKENTMSSKSKKVKLESRERYQIYKALGSSIATMRNKLGEAVYQEHDDLKKNIKKSVNLMEKIKKS